MRSNYKRIGDYIREVDERNAGLKVKNLLGLSISKQFISSVANIVGTDMENYKIIRKNQFACSIMQVRRDKKMPVALLKEADEAIISQAYPVFEIIDTNVLMPEYLMMWFSRQEFDREACFYAVGGVRGSLEWGDFLDMKLPVPSIDKQKEIVKEYNVIISRIELNNKLIKRLEETAQSVYKNWFVDNKENEGEIRELDELCSLITDGKHGDSEDEPNSGYYFISVKDLIAGEIIYENSRQITKNDFEETHKRTNLSPGDILLTNSGTIGRMVIIKDIPQTKKTTFQKSVAILKPNKKLTNTYFLYSLLKFNIKSLIDLAGGSTQSNLLLGDLRQYKINYPGFIAVSKFEKNIHPVFQILGIKGLENQNLFKLKNLLLSKLATIEN